MQIASRRSPIHPCAHPHATREGGTLAFVSESSFPEMEPSSVSHGLAPWWARIFRAYDQWDALMFQVARWRRWNSPVALPQHPSYFSGPNLLQPGERVELSWAFGQVSPFPASWPLLIGELLHNVRAALDNVIWDLARPGLTQAVAAIERATGTQKKRDAQIQRLTHSVLFPYTEAQFDRISSILPDHAVAFLRHAKPGPWYQPGLYTWSQDLPHPFRVLQEMNNGDKHRLPNITVARIDRGEGWETPPPDLEVWTAAGPLTYGDPCMRETFTWREEYEGRRGAPIVPLHNVSVAVPNTDWYVPVERGLKDIIDMTNVFLLNLHPGSEPESRRGVEPPLETEPSIQDQSEERQAGRDDPGRTGVV